MVVGARLPRPPVFRPQATAETPHGIFPLWPPGRGPQQAEDIVNSNSALGLCNQRFRNTLGAVLAMEKAALALYRCFSHGVGCWLVELDGHGGSESPACSASCNNSMVVFNFVKKKRAQR